jgi:hypothetical protein
VQEAKDNVRLFFVKKSGFPDFSFPRIHRSFSPLPRKTVDRENTTYLGVPEHANTRTSSSDIRILFPEGCMCVFSLI